MDENPTYHSLREECSYNEHVRRFFGRLGFALCIAAGVVCMFLHVTTFVAIVPPTWVLFPFALLFGAVLCANAAGTQARFAAPTIRRGLVTVVLLVYAVVTFLYFYQSTGGASSVNLLDGRYVAMYKDRVIRTITEQEYRMFPSLWTRVMSAWMGVMALLGLMHLAD